MKRKLLILLFIGFSTLFGQTLYINEFVAKYSTPPPESCMWFGCVDFVEIYNPGTDPVDVAGWYVTDDLNNPTYYQIPEGYSEITTVPPGDFILMHPDNQSSLGPLHFNFGLSSGGEQFGLSNPSGEFVDSISFWWDWPYDNSYGRSPDGGNVWEWYYNPSPGRSNITIRINEFLAKNDNINQDENGNYGDWLELYNYGELDVDLTGMHLTDDFTDPTLYTFPDAVIQPGEFLLVWCDQTTDDPVTDPDIYHTNFKLSAGGDMLGLFYDANGTMMAIDSLTFGAQTADVSYGRFPDAADNWVTFSQPTPGSTNEVAEGPLISDVVRNPLFPEATDEVLVTANISTSSSGLSVELNYRPNYDSYLTVPMLDDGLHGDGEAGDGLFGGSIPANSKGTVIYWYIVASDDAPSESFYPASAPGVPFSYRVTIWTPVQVVDLAIREPSGIAFNANSGTLFTHNDGNNANIYEISTSGIKLDSLMVSGNDFEGIAFNATYDTMFLVQEATWEIVKYTLDGTNVGTLSINHDPGLTDGPEGIAVDHSNGHIFVLQEKNPSQLIELSSDGTELNRTTLNFFDDVSGMCIHPTWGTLLIVSDQGYSLNEVTKDGVHLRSWYIPLDQVEGVTFGATATTLYMVADRGNKFYEFLFDFEQYSAPPNLYINEFLASNDFCCTDENGEYDDFLEIYNGDNESIDVGGLYITDNLTQSTLWQIPDTASDETTIAPGEFLVLWCDNTPDQGATHTNFKLGAGGEQIGLFTGDLAAGGMVIDTLTYASQTTDISNGRYPDGTDNWGSMDPSPGSANTELLSVINGGIVPMQFALHQNYPNPFNPTTTIRFDIAEQTFVTISIWNILGQTVNTLAKEQMNPGSYKLEFNGTDRYGKSLSSGVYLISVETPSWSSTNKMMLLK